MAECPERHTNSGRIALLGALPCLFARRRRVRLVSAADLDLWATHQQDRNPGGARAGFFPAMARALDRIENDGGDDGRGSDPRNDLSSDVGSRRQVSVSLEAFVTV